MGMTKRLMIMALAAALLPLFAAPASAGWSDALDKVKNAVEANGASTSETSATALGAGLSASEIASGLKAALEKATKAAVSSLGVKDGFLGNAKVKIPLPDAVGKAETALRLLGRGELADSFVTSMNRAAEQAVPETLDVLGSAVSKMTIDDAKGILNGGDTAATDFFRRTSDTALAEKIQPLVSTAMADVDVTQYYKNMVSAASAAGVSTTDYDLDAYVTRKALDGLYYMMEQEEAEIRKNPVARTSEILEKVFGNR